MTNVGDSLPVKYQAAAYSTGLFPKATIRNSDGDEIAGSPVNLTAVGSLGAYQATGLMMPDTQWVSIKVAVYTDSGHTTLSTSDGGTVEVVQSDKVQTKIPVLYQAADYDSDQFPVATIVDENGDEIDGSPVNLASVDDSGLYLANNVAMPASAPRVSINTAVYSDEGHTTLSDEGGTNEQFYAVDPGFPPAGVVIGMVEQDLCSPFPRQDTIIQGSDRTISVRLIQETNGEPFDLSGATLLEFRFRNADGSVLSLKSTDAGSPVQVISATLGKLLCVLTAAQTVLLKPLNPSPFSIKVTQPEGVTIVNLPTQLAVEAEAI